MRLRIEIQNTGDRDAGPASMEIDVPTTISDYGLRWTDAGGNELPDAPERAARIGSRNYSHRTVDLIGRDVGKIVFVTLPTPVPEAGTAEYPLAVRVNAEGAGPTATTYVLRIRRQLPRDG